VSGVGALAGSSASLAVLYLAAVVLSLLGGLPGLLLPPDSRLGQRLATLASVAGALIGLASAAIVLATGTVSQLFLPWPVPSGVFSIRVDLLAAFFSIPIFLISGLGAIYGEEYWPNAKKPESGGKLRFFYGATSAGLALVMAAGDAVTFLAAWEVAGLAGYFLVTTDSDDPSVRETGWIYLVATHASTLLLFGAFAFLGRAAGTLSLGAVAAGIAGSPTGRAIFFLALAGFGIKAGLMPLHVWLPGAHAGAPSHVSALMSGALIKMGIYGIVRIVSLFPDPPVAWGEIVFLLGTVSALLGVAFALAQHDLKRLLAYHSIENIGIILMGIGLGMVGSATNRIDLCILGYAGGLLHVWNHALFKALLFFEAGAVVHSTGTRNMERLGGLAKRMPKSAALFLVGSVAICGLPPLNGLVSELLVYLGLFRAISPGGAGGQLWLLGALGAPALAMVGALALACFVKAFSAVFLGSPRTPDAEKGHEPGLAMLFPGYVLATACLAIGLGAPLLAPLAARVAGAAAPGSEMVEGGLFLLGPLASLALVGIATLAIVAFLGRYAWSSTRGAPANLPTWDCGFARPTSRMQYGASSTAREIVAFFRWILRPEIHAPKLSGPFALPSRFESHSPETVLERFLLPAARGFAWLAARVRSFHPGRVQLDIAYVALTLLVLLALVAR
jgi:hydrogenase-4 component B